MSYLAIKDEFGIIFKIKFDRIGVLNKKSLCRNRALVEKRLGNTVLDDRLFGRGVFF